MSEYLANLSDAVTAMHGVSCTHSSTARVIETMDGKEVWNGDVEVFELSGHANATKAFAWGYKDEQCEIKYMAVLNVPPIDSPREAVQAAIASGRFK